MEITVNKLTQRLRTIWPFPVGTAVMVKNPIHMGKRVVVEWAYNEYGHVVCKYNIPADRDNWIYEIPYSPENVWVDERFN